MEEELKCPKCESRRTNRGVPLKDWDKPGIKVEEGKCIDCGHEWKGKLPDIFKN